MDCAAAVGEDRADCSLLLHRHIATGMLSGAPAQTACLARAAASGATAAPRQAPTDASSSCLPTERPKQRTLVVFHAILSVLTVTSPMLTPRGTCTQPSGRAAAVEPSQPQHVCTRMCPVTKYGCTCACLAAQHPAHRDKHGARDKQRKQQQPGGGEARVARLQPSVGQRNECEVAAGRRRFLRLPGPGDSHTRLGPGLCSAAAQGTGRAWTRRGERQQEPAASGGGWRQHNKQAVCGWRSRPDHCV